MATTSELDKIRRNPIKERLATFRHRFESTRSDLDVASSSDIVQAVFSTAVTAVAKSLVLDLIQALLIEPAARILPSRIADRTLSGDLAILYGRLDSNQLDSASAIPLVEQIVGNEPDTPTWNDADIWHAVFELVARTNPATPPTAFEKAVFDTPLRSSSASQRGIEQTHEEVDQRILEELTGRVYYDVGGFYERYFEGKSWTNNARDIYTKSMTQYIEGRWSGWPEPAVQDIKNLLLDLILALQNQTAARILGSRIGDRTLAGDLGILYGRVDSNQSDLASAIPLVEQVVKNEPDAPTSNDVDIWQAVFELVARTNPATPPTAFEKILFDTPLRSSSASQRGIEQRHDEVDQRILEELTGRVYYDVGGFYERYFEGKVWTNDARDIYEESRAQYTEGRWSGWPQPSIQSRFFEWFMKFQDTVLSGLRRRYYTSANKVLRGSEADRKLDIFLTPADAALPDGEHDWSNVLVIGEHKQNPDEDGSAKTLVQLAGYAREVFGSQPERRFVPGFTICGSMMRLWVFDRPGLYNSEKLYQEDEDYERRHAKHSRWSDLDKQRLLTYKTEGGNGFLASSQAGLDRNTYTLEYGPAQRRIGFLPQVDSGSSSSVRLLVLWRLSG